MALVQQATGGQPYGAPPLSLRPGDPERRRRLLRRRAALERVVEKGLAALDRLDGDPDLEPSLGAVEFQTNLSPRDRTWTAYREAMELAAPGPLNDDREADGVTDADFEPDVDGEHILGWAEVESRTGRFVSSSEDDLEDGGDAEPVGWSERGSLSGSLDGGVGTEDAEDDGCGEPSLTPAGAWAGEDQARRAGAWAAAGTDDREASSDDEEGDAAEDREPENEL